MNAEDTIKEILADYAEALEKDQVQRKSGALWIFQPNVPHQLYAKRLLAVVTAERALAAREATMAMTARIGWECACKCHKHQKIACPHCLNVYGCPVHYEVP